MSPFFCFYLSLFTSSSRYSWMVVQTIWYLSDGNVDSKKVLPLGGVLRGRHEVDGELEQFSHPDMPNGTWGVYCPATGCGAGHGMILPLYHLTKH
jgi:hypothetical protein